MTLQIKRGTRSDLDRAALLGTLSVGEPILITDEARLAIATSASAYTAMAKLSEAGGGGGGTTLAALTDVNVAGVGAGSLLNYDSAAAKWQPTFQPNNQLFDGGNF